MWLPKRLKKAIEASFLGETDEAPQPTDGEPAAPPDASRAGGDVTGERPDEATSPSTGGAPATDALPADPAEPPEPAPTPVAATLAGAPDLALHLPGEPDPKPRKPEESNRHGVALETPPPPTSEPSPAATSKFPWPGSPAEVEAELLDTGESILIGISIEGQALIRQEVLKTRNVFKKRAIEILYEELSSPKTPAAFPTPEAEAEFLDGSSRRALEQAREELAPIELRLTDRQARRLLDEILAGVIGFGAVQPLLEDATVSEVMINGPARIFAERFGRIQRTPFSFEDETQLMRVIHKIVSPIGRRVDRSSPTCDARLPDGSRVNIVLPPLALNGPTVTIRKFSHKPLQLSNLVEKGSLTPGMAAFLEGCIRLRLNLVVSGGTGSGKTTTLNVLSTCIPEDERIVTLEDAAELALQQEHVVNLEARPVNAEGRGEVPLRALLRNALRMRPDRIVVGECRGPEALDMLQAMNTGHEGSMTTGHANTPRDMVARLETMVLMGGMPLSSRTIREQIARSVHLIVQQARLHDGTRKIVSISEVLGMEGDSVALAEIFRFVKEGIDASGKVLGRFEFTGSVPTFLHRFQEEGLTLPPDVFGEGHDAAKMMKRLLREREKAARKEREKLEEQALQSAGQEVPYEQSSLMMAIRGMHVIRWMDEEFAPPAREPGKKSRPEQQVPRPGGRQELTDKEILGPMHDWALGELSARLKRLMAFEKVELRGQHEAERAAVREKLGYCFREMADDYRIRANPAAIDRLIDVALRDAVGLGPIQPLVDDPGIDEVMVNGPRQIYVERRGKLILTEVRFRDDAHVRHIIDRVLTEVGRRADDSTPIADARLRDGSRVNVVLSPISLVGAVLTIRKFSAKPLAVPDLVARGTLSPEMALFLEAAVKAKVSLVVAGGTGSGKTSTLNALSAFIPEGERIVTIEDAAELRLQQPHIVPLESRPASREGTGGVTIRDLVRNSLRMRPDRVVIGECRGPEALDMLQAMNTGHEGSMTTAHANSPKDLVGRIETMVLMGDIPLTSRAIREQIFSAIQLVVQQERLPDGSRRITSLAEFTAFAGETVVAREIFRFDRSPGGDFDEATGGRFVATGHFPRFLEDLSLSGLELPDGLFGAGTSVAGEIHRRAEAAEETRLVEQLRSEKAAGAEAPGPSPASGGPDFHWKHAMAARRKRRSGDELSTEQLGKERLAEDRARAREQLLPLVTHRAMSALGAIEHPIESQIRQIVRDCGTQVLLEHPAIELPRKARQQLFVEAFDEVAGLGPIQPLLEDPGVSEVMVNGPGQIYVERSGKLTLSNVTFRDDAHAQHVLNRILSPLSRRCDVRSPLVDARLADGSRVNAAIPPVALNGPVLTIRKFSKVPYDLGRLVEAGAMSPAVAGFLEKCVRMRLNMVISGGTGSGKTTLLNALSGEIPEGERVVTIEDSAELSLQVAHVVGLESRLPNVEGRGGVPVRELVRNALRMRPDRIVVGECRGAEALDMLQAMNTGHEGSMTTAHANSSQELLARIETMVLMAGTGATIRGIREQIAGAVDLVIQARRFHDGRRRVVQVTEVLGLDGDDLALADLFAWRSDGVDPEGRTVGQLAPTGTLPSFLERMRLEGFAVPPEIFTGPIEPGEAKLKTLQSLLEATGIKWPL